MASSNENIKKEESQKERTERQADLIAEALARNLNKNLLEEDSEYGEWEITFIPRWKKKDNTK